MTQIAQTLTRLFDRHRIIFWYDAKRELRAEFEAVELAGVEKIVIVNNEFGVKYRILRAEPDQKFLLYHEGPAPEHAGNWLLDVQLAQGQFRADQTALWLTELGLGFEFVDVVEAHAEFFRAAARRQALKNSLRPDDTADAIRMKMAAVCANAGPRLDEIIESLLAELAAKRDDKMRLLQRCALDDLLWTRLERAYGYHSQTPGPRDFAIELFKSGYALSLGETAHLNQDALVLLRRWKDNVRHQEAFEALSAECADILGIETDLQGRDYRTLAEIDLFEVIDRKVLSDLGRDVASRTLDAATVEIIVRQRRQSHWFGRFRHLYEAIAHAAAFLHMVDGADFALYSLADGIDKYTRRWFQLDQRYRKFIYHARQSGQTTLLASLADGVENLYNNNYLLTVNDRWQQQVDASPTWDIPGIVSQRAFFEHFVDGEHLRHGNKVFVVISDALRYEVGEELLQRIRQEDRYDATLAPLLASLPSYTQLGMAALLPHDTLAIGEDGSTVLVDGASSVGLENRKKIVDMALPNRATALKAEDLLVMGKEESRALTRDYDVVYVYHNRIDAMGDKRESEERVFEAVEDTLEEVVKIIKKLANANASNILVTADHGFLYQNRVLEESDFASAEPSGEHIVNRNRRFVLGTDLTASSSFKKYTAVEVGLQGDLEILLPKSINRLRVRGAGSRYVHGGAALQEVVVPVLAINKKRQSDVSAVQVDILRGAASVITTGQFTVTFYQSEPVTAKIQGRKLIAGIYTQNNVLVSDRHELTFDLTSVNAREREVAVRFILTSNADEANGQEVILQLHERVDDTSHYTLYRSARYLLRRAFSSDFDF